VTSSSTIWFDTYEALKAAHEGMASARDVLKVWRSHGCEEIEFQDGSSIKFRVRTKVPLERELLQLGWTRDQVIELVKSQVQLKPTRTCAAGSGEPPLPKPPHHSIESGGSCVSCDWSKLKRRIRERETQGR
jgi:hypothetical protein